MYVSADDAKIEDISNRIKEEYYEPDYMAFKKLGVLIYLIDQFYIQENICSC
ncbi:hypothetical protein AAHB52_20895 [Bacillus toyonensis]